MPVPVATSRIRCPGRGSTLLHHRSAPAGVLAEAEDGAHLVIAPGQALKQREGVALAGGGGGVHGHRQELRARRRYVVGT